MKEDEFLSYIGDCLPTMRLTAEGAVLIYEDEITQLYSKAIREACPQNALYLDTIGRALILLREQLCKLQEAYMSLLVQKDGQAQESNKEEG